MKKIIEEVDEYRQAAATQGGSVSRSVFIRKLEMLLKKVQLILFNSPTFAQTSLF